MMNDKLKEIMQMGGYDQNIEQAQRESDTKNRNLYIAQALSDFMTSGTDVSSDKSFYDDLRSETQKPVLNEKEKKKQAIVDYIRQQQEAKQAKEFDYRQNRDAIGDAGRQEQMERQRLGDEESKRRWEAEFGFKQEQANKDRQGQNIYDIKVLPDGSAYKVNKQSGEYEQVKGPGEVKEGGLDRDTAVSIDGVETQARTKDDAKKIKDAQEQAAILRMQMKELIDLRKDKGVEFFDREAVARGKQLAKDALLTYKNLAKLGVLSKSDEDIINAIIPSDPLGMDYMPLQDSILTQLEGMYGDIDKKLETFTKGRVQPSEPKEQVSPSRQVRYQGKLYNVDAQGNMTEVK